MTDINFFPDEILEQIFFHLLPYADLDNCALVCKRWSLIIHGVRRLTSLSLHKGLVDTSQLYWQPHTGHNSIAAVNEQRRSLSSQPSSSSSSPSTSAGRSSSSSSSQSPSPTAMPAPAIAARFSHATIVHDNSMYLYGGGSSATTFNDLWRFDLSTRRWHRPLSTGTYPTPKACASIVAHDNRLIVFGGWCHPSANQLHQSWRLFNELHSYSIDGRVWEHHTVPSGGRGPPPMTGHSVSVHRDRMIVFGGFQQQELVRRADDRRLEVVHNRGGDNDDGAAAVQLIGSSNSVWCLDLLTFEWEEMPTSAQKPPPRYGQFQVRLDDDRLLVLGGCGGPNNMFSDAWILRMDASPWQWDPIRIGNRKMMATYMWCNPACRVGTKIVQLGPITTLPTDLQLIQPHGVIVRVANAPDHENPRPNHQNPNELRQPDQPDQHHQHHHHHHNNPAAQHEQRMHLQQQQAAPLPPIAPRTPSQIVEEANRRLQNDLLNRSPRSPPRASTSAAAAAAAAAQPSSPSNRPQLNQNPHHHSPKNQRVGPGPSSGVLVRRPDRDSAQAAASAQHDDDEEAVNRLKRNLQLKSRDHDDADQFLPKRFNQPPGGEPLGMSAFSVNMDTSGPAAAAGAGPSGSGGMSPSGSGGGPLGGGHHADGSPQQQHERRMESLRRMEAKIRSIQNGNAAPVGPIVLPSPSPPPPSPPRPRPLPQPVRFEAPAPVPPNPAHPAVNLAQAAPAEVPRKKDLIGVFVCDISTLLDGSADPVLEWLESRNGGRIDGAPERQILSSLVAGNGELLMFGGLRKESMANATISTLVSDKLHFLKFRRGVL